MSQNLGTIERIEFRNGTSVAIRAICTDDVQRLQAFFGQLSPQSVFFRFLTYWKELTRERAEYMTRVNYRTRMALVATIVRGGNEQIIGVASYALLAPAEEWAADASVVVLDSYQGMGIGTALLKHLAEHARLCNIRTFVGTIHAENTQMLKWLERSGLAVTVNGEEGASELQARIELPFDLESWQDRHIFEA